MNTPFPGMDPYLEQPGVWNQVHTHLISHIQHFLAQKVEPNYYVVIEQLTYLSLTTPNDTPSHNRPGKPDVLVVSGSPKKTPTEPVAVMDKSHIEPIVAALPMLEEVKHRYLKIKSVGNNEVITIIEILSPANKRGRGREEYETKRQEIFRSQTNLVEIDLLRQGQPLPMGLSQTNDYRIMVSRGHERPWAEIYLFSLRDAIPDVPIPLRQGDEEPVLPLNDILHDIYEQGRYYLFVDYSYTLTPAVSDKVADWINDLVASASP